LNGARKDSVAKLQEELGDEVPMKQTWLSVLGNTTRADHANLDGVPENKKGLWNLGGTMIPWPAHISLPPDQRCNCQCSLTISFGMRESEAERLIGEHGDRMKSSELRWKHGDHDQSTHGRGGGGGSSRAERAKRTHKPSTAEKQRRGEAEQARLAKVIGGQDEGDNLAFDVRAGNHAIEVKTVMDNNNDKITMHKSSRLRKMKEAEENGWELHTVAIDVRGGKRSYYYREGVGSFRLGNMQSVTVGELKDLFG
jgi:hypothetical protein